MPVMFAVPAEGVGRKDYSQAAEYFVEPVISSWQSVYSMRQSIVVPALGSLVTDIPVTPKHVVLLYDFFASITENRLIRLQVAAVDQVGTVGIIVDDNGYQTVVEHLSKGQPFFIIIRFIVQNYSPVNQSCRIGCTGIITSLQEFYLNISTLPPLL